MDVPSSIELRCIRRYTCQSHWACRSSQMWVGSIRPIRHRSPSLHTVRLPNRKVSPKAGTWVPSAPTLTLRRRHAFVRTPNDRVPPGWTCMTRLSSLWQCCIDRKQVFGGAEYRIYRSRLFIRVTTTTTTTTTTATLPTTARRS